MHKMKKLLALSLASLTLVGLVGCSNEDEDPLMSESKESLVAMINEGNTRENEYLTRISELETLLKGVQGEEVETSGIETMDDGTGRETFVSTDGQITFPVEFNYPGATQATNEETCVKINEAFSVRPTSNWTVKVDGASIELYHTSGISGKITVGKRDRDVQKTTLDELKTYMNDTFFAELPPESITYNTIFINGKEFGWDASSHTFIDSEDAKLRCGLVGYSDQSLQYFFVYKGEDDSAKNEVILSLLQTIKAWNDNLSIK